MDLLDKGLQTPSLSLSSNGVTPHQSVTRNNLFQDSLASAFSRRYCAGYQYPKADFRSRQGRTGIHEPWQFCQTLFQVYTDGYASKTWFRHFLLTSLQICCRQGFSRLQSACLFASPGQKAKSCGSGGSRSCLFGFLSGILSLACFSFHLLLLFGF